MSNRSRYLARTSAAGVGTNVSGITGPIRDLKAEEEQKIERPLASQPTFQEQKTSYTKPQEIYAPRTTVTTADATDQRAANLVNHLMYVPDNISIDSVVSLEGADAATGDTTRFHLMSYTFNSGSTSCLTDGTLVAHNSDTTNAGSEQIYKSTWTIDSASVSAGKVLVCTFESDSVNSDYSCNVVVKYHLV